MKKQTILKFIHGQLSGQEKEAVLDWIEASEENRQYFYRLKNISSILAPANESMPDHSFAALQSRMFRRRRSRGLGPRMSVFVSAAAICAVASLTFILIKGPEIRYMAPLAQIENHDISIYTPLCAKAEITLPDGTQVWLNSGSRLTYPRTFDGESRTVKLDGEAYFDVVSDENFPFVVETRLGADIQVKGTSFNLCAYHDDKLAEVTLIEGAVAFMSGGGDKIDMTPSQLLRYRSDTQEVDVVNKERADVHTAWRDGILMFDNMSMRELCRKLERWYGVNISILDEEISGNTYTGSFKDETIKQVLELMKQTSDIDYRINDKHIKIARKRESIRSDNGSVV